MKKEITIEEKRFIFFLVFLFVLFFGYVFTENQTHHSISVNLQKLSNNSQIREEVLQTIKASARSKHLIREHPKEHIEMLLTCK